MHRLLALLFALLLVTFGANAQTVRAPIATGDTPRAVAVNPVTNKVYVINEFGNSVSVVDGTTGTVTATVPVGSRPEYVAVNPQTNRIYVSHGDASLVVIDGNTNATASYPIGSTGPIAINPANSIVYIVRLSSPATDEITRFDDTGAVPTWYSMSTNSFQPMDMTLDPITNILYVIHYPAGHVRAIDGSSTSDFPPSTQIDVGKPADMIAMNPITNRIYALTENSASPIAVINGADNTFVPLAPTVGTPKGVAINPVTNKIYAAFSGQVVIVDGATNAFTVVPSGSAAGGPSGIAINVVTNKVYVPNSDGTLTIIDGDTNATRSIAIPANANYAAVNPVTNTVYVTSPSGLTIVDGATTDAAHAIPLTTAITQTTTGASPTFQFTATTTYGPASLPVQRVYYRLDSLTGPWQLASGSGPFTGSASALSAGRHVLYAFAADGQDVPMTGMQSMPVIGAISSYAFNVGTAPPKVDPTVSLTATPNPATAGQSVTLTATVGGSAGAATGSIDFLDGTAPVAGCSTAAIFNATATCVTSAISAGTHSITARYTGDASYNARTSDAVSLVVNVQKTTPTVSLTSSLNPSTSGQMVTFTASVTGSTGTATGTVTFVDGTTALASCSALPLSGGSATCSTSALATGTHSIAAQYSGDTFYNAVNSSALTQSVNAATLATATVSLTPSPNPSVTGQSVTLSVTVSGASGAPTGTVDVRDGSTTIAGCAALPLTAGAASCSTSALTAGNHSLTAAYSGDATYGPNTSAVVTQTVNVPKSDPTVALSASPASPAVVGQSVTLTANVAGGGASAPTGIVTFQDGGTTIAECSNISVASGTATCTTSSLTVGTHSLSGQYSGDGSYNPAASNTLTYTVNPKPKVAPTVTVSSSSNPARAGTSVVFTANVSGSAGVATGSVDFLDGTTPLCSAVALSSGGATCTTSALGAGDHSITASYAGDANYLAGTSNALAQRIASAHPKRTDYNGDGKADLTWINPGMGSQGVWLMNGTSATSFSAESAGAGYVLKLTGDFDGDGRTDLLYRGPDGSYKIQLMNGTAVVAENVILNGGTGWEVVGKGDFNGDGKTDLLWKAANGTYGLWLMNGTTFSSAGLFQAPGPGWDSVIVADFDGDGKDDILWQHLDGRVQMWLMNGFLSTAQADMVTVANGWTPTFAGDFNGDGKADLLWKHTNGSVGLWLVNGTTITSYNVMLGPNSGWSVKAVGDLDGDGKSDIVLTHTNGSVGGWIMNGAAVTSFGAIGSPGWTPVLIDDLDGDGRADIVWRDASGAYAASLMNGLGTLSSASLIAGGTGWNVLP